MKSILSLTLCQTSLLLATHGDPAQDQDFDDSGIIVGGNGSGHVVLEWVD